jgi:YHS domain-containing protein
MSKKTLLLVIFLVFSVALVMAAVDKKAGEETLKCPVSGKEFTKSEASPKYEYEGKTYYFCCAGCKAKFAENPEKMPMMPNMQSTQITRMIQKMLNMHTQSTRTMTIKHMLRKTGWSLTLSVE